MKQLLSVILLFLLEAIIIICEKIVSVCNCWSDSLCVTASPLLEKIFESEENKE